MSCTRCAGLLLREWIHRTREHDPDCRGWWLKCVQCGARVDLTILRNQAEQAAMAAAQRVEQERLLNEWADWLGNVPVGQPLAIARAVSGMSG